MSKLIDKFNEIMLDVYADRDNYSRGKIIELAKEAFTDAVNENWNYTDKEKPLTYITGDWDGKNSDNVVAEDKSGKQYLAYYCDGFMDGSEFSGWCTSSGWDIAVEIVRWLPIPE